MLSQMWTVDVNFVKAASLSCSGRRVSDGGSLMSSVDVHRRMEHRVSVQFSIL